MADIALNWVVGTVGRVAADVSALKEDVGAIKADVAGFRREFRDFRDGLPGIIGDVMREVLLDSKA